VHNTKKLPFKPFFLDDFRTKIVETIKKDINEISESSELTTKQVGFMPVDQEGEARLDYPEESGWTFLINEKDSTGEKIIEAVSPLAEYRNMDGIDSPFLFNNSPKQSWLNWIKKYNMEKKGKGKFKRPPQYVLIIGGPNNIPFEFQKMLSLVAHVGRIDFDNVEQVKNYAEKVKRIESNRESIVNKEVTFFATDHDRNDYGCHDPTHYNCFAIEDELMPDVGKLSKQKYAPNVNLIRSEATKMNFLERLPKSKPALVYASTWGMSAPEESMTLQQKYTGAICCQGDYKNDPDYDILLLTADDIPKETPFLEGSIFFQQSSFSYGTPSVSLVNYVPDQGMIPKKIAPTDFVASLPKKLVFHPQGPLAFVGHMDELLSFSYGIGESVDRVERREQLAPFSTMIDHLLNGRPIGYALKEFTSRVSTANNELPGYDTALSGIIKDKKKKEEMETKAAQLFLERNELQNYMIFGDPAVRIQQ
jgi:hypothetical protein